MKKTLLATILLFEVLCQGLGNQTTTGYVSIDVDNILKDYSATNSNYSREEFVQNEIQKIRNLGLLDRLDFTEVEHDAHTPLVKYTIAYALGRLIELPIVKTSLEILRNKGFPLQIKVSVKKNKETSYGITMGNEIIMKLDNIVKANTLQLTKFTDSDPIRPSHTGILYRIDQFLMNENFANDHIDLNRTFLAMVVATLVHELGHVVCIAFTASQIQNTGETLEVLKEDKELWLKTFYKQFDSDWQTEIQKNKLLSQYDIYSTTYSRKSLGERFAEDFMLSVLEGKLLGNSEKAKFFEKELSR